MNLNILTKNNSTIFGKSEKIQPKVENLFEKIKQDIQKNEWKVELNERQNEE